MFFGQVAFEIAAPLWIEMRSLRPSTIASQAVRNPQSDPWFLPLIPEYCRELLSIGSPSEQEKSGGSNSFDDTLPRFNPVPDVYSANPVPQQKRRDGLI